MNRLISRIGSALVIVSVFLFALFLIIDFSFGSFLVCMFLPIGYILMAAGFHNECEKDRRVAANIGMVFSAIYAVLIFLVYYAQTTSVRLETLTEQARNVLDFRRLGLIFYYDLLGYGMMALSTFFIGFSIKPKTKCDKWLKALMLIHGFFFISCFFMPIFGVFAGKASNGETSNGGATALVIWCFYFLPIGVLAFLHFGKKKNACVVRALHHVSMKCKDKNLFEKAVSFYTEILGFKIKRRWAEGVMLVSGTAAIEIFCNGDGIAELGAIRHFALATDCVDELAAKVEKAGYEVFIKPKDIVIPSEPEFHAHIAFFYGPLGEQVELFCPENL